MGSLKKAALRYGGVAAVVAGILVGRSAMAQELPRANLLASMASQGWVRFDLTAGRVLLTVMRPRQIQSGRERLAIRPMGSESTLDYGLTTAEEELSIHCASGNRLEIRRSPKGDAKITPVVFEQPATGPVVLKVGADKDVREYRAASLWHLLLAEPAECRQSLLPLLSLLQPNWDLVKTGEEVRAALVRMAESGARLDNKQWAQWVQQLGDDQFAKREEAEQQLRAAGRSIVSYLQQLDSARLDAEQRYRIRRVLRALTAANGNDMPEHVASWLFADPAVWLAMLSSPEESVRKTAARQLEAIRGGPVAFDPTADPETRKKQIEALRKKKG